MRNFAAFLILFFETVCLNAQTIIPAGNVSGTWSDPVYEVQGDILIPDGLTLSISPGVKVQFSGNYQLKIFGTLLAKGTSTQKITFTSKDTTGFYKMTDNSGGWRGIFFNNGTIVGGGCGGCMIDNDTSRIDYCVIKYVKDINAQFGGGITTQECSRLIISNSDIIYNVSKWAGAGIYLFVASPKIINNNISYNKDRTLGYGGSGIYSFRSSSYIANNIISYNMTNTSGGGVYFSDSPVYFENNFVSNNRATYASGNGGGMLIAGADQAVIINNIFCNNTAPNSGGIYCINTYGARFINNTIAYNYTPGNGGGIFISQASPEFYNTILWGNDAAVNGDQVVINDNLCEPNFYSCDIQGGKPAFYIPGGVSYQGQMVNCKDINPDFVTLPAGTGYLNDGLTAANWRVKEGSPCINEGVDAVPSVTLPSIDVYKDKRIRFGKIDIGASEYYQSSKLVTCANSTISSNTKWIADTVKVSCHVTINDNITLSIYPGTMVQFQGHYKIKVIGTLLAQGNVTDSIRFTIANPTDHDNMTNFNGGWLSVRFDNSSSGSNGIMKDNDTSRFEYCVFEYGKAKQVTLSDEHYGGAIYASEYSKIIVSNCRFNRNIANSGGGAIALFSHSNPVIKNNIFENNICNSVAGVIYFGTSSPIISHNLFYNNKEGIMYIGDNSTPLIDGNTIINNGTWRKALEINESSPIISNNIICNNAAAVFISNYCPNPVFINNTIANNGSGITFYLYSNATFHNNILWNNGSQFSFPDNTSTLSIYNCNVQYGISGIPSAYIIDSSNILNTDPEFINPTSGTGYGVNARNANWGLYSISTMINAGSTSGISSLISTTDASGNPRINSTQLDLGALENQNGIPVLTLQPQNKITCEGNQVIFSVTANDTASYQWQLNGSNISGAISPVYNISSASPSHQGNYNCILTNAYGSVSSSNVMLNVNLSPFILSQPKASDVCNGESFSVDASITGSAPMTFEWKKDGSVLAGAVSSQYLVSAANSGNTGFYKLTASNSCGTKTTDSVKISVHALPTVALGKDTTVCKEHVLDAGAYKQYQWQDYSNARKIKATSTGDYYVRVTDNYNCSAISDTITVTVKQPYGDEKICMVSVSDSLNKNRIVWNRTKDKSISSYNIYKLIGPSYILTGNIPFGQTSSFIDFTSLPESVTARYAISVIDSCGNESEKSPYHQTMLLGAAKGTASNQAILNWVKYEDESGSFVPDYYIIYKGKTKSSLSVLDSVSGLLPSMYIDNNFDGISAYYQIAIRKPSPCDPSILKSESGPYTQSLSNIAEYKTEKAGLGNNTLSASAYPNPFSENITLSYSLENQEDVFVEVIDALGTKVALYEFSGQASGTNNVELSLSQLPAGVFTLKIIAENKIQTLMCVKQ